MNDIYFSQEKNKTEKGVLYLVATPIGNTADIGERALKVLSEVDFIAAEDTRNTGKLLSLYGIKQSYISYHEHNKAQCGVKLVEKLKAGQSCALVTDAGMPAVSDPGEDIVKLCIENGIKVTCVPGPSAFTMALVLSGMNTRRFVFEGFLDGTKGEKKARLEKVGNDDRTLIFYESPHKLRATLALMLEILGNRRIALCRELTKLNEEIIRTDIENAINMYVDKEPRGEYVLVIDGVSESEKEKAFDNMTVGQHIEYYMTEEGLTKNEAIKKVAKDRGVPKNEIYKHTIRTT